MVYVKDASRAVGVCQSLITPERRAEVIGDSRPTTRERREQHKGRKAKAPAFTLAQARANRLRCDWPAYRPPVPRMLGVRAFESIPLDELVRYIDWMPFFNAWEFAGKFPDILTDPIVGEAGEQPVRRRPAHAEADDRRALAAGATR